jgi:hypothetical protein
MIVTPSSYCRFIHTYWKSEEKMLPLSSESISQIKVLQHTNAAYLFNVQRIVTQNGDMNFFVTFGLENSLLRKRPPFLKHPVYICVCVCVCVCFQLTAFRMRRWTPVETPCTPNWMHLSPCSLLLESENGINQWLLYISTQVVRIQQQLVSVLIVETVTARDL